MKKWAKRLLFAAVFSLAVTPVAMGDTVTMTIVNPLLYGEDGPYNAVINGTQAAKVVCDNIDAVTYLNASNTYRVALFDDLNFSGTKFFTGTNGNLYLQAAYLTGQLLDLNSSTLPSLCSGLSAATCRSNIQDALWSLFDNSATLPNITLTPGITAWVNQAAAVTAGSNVVAFADYRILTPIDPQTGTILGSSPQEFIMRTPEGSALALLAGNMLGLAGLVRLFRKRTNKTS